MERKLDGQHLKDFRSYQGMTQSELAECLGVSVRTVQNWELRGLPWNTFRMIKGLFLMASWDVDRENENVTLTSKEFKTKVARILKIVMEYP